MSVVCIITSVYIYGTNARDLVVAERKNGLTWERMGEWTYDGQGRVLTEKDAAGGVTSYGYNTNGQVVTMTNALAEVVTFSYDGLGRLVAVDGPLAGTGDRILLGYDSVVLTRVKTVTDVDGRVT